MAVFAAADLILAGQPDAHAGNRPAPKQSVSTSAHASAHASAAKSSPDAGKYERKCVIMSCGTPWCFNTRR